LRSSILNASIEEIVVSQSALEFADFTFSHIFAFDKLIIFLPLVYMHNFTDIPIYTLYSMICNWPKLTEVQGKILSSTIGASKHE
jgi:hypothetical protein